MLKVQCICVSCMSILVSSKSIVAKIIARDSRRMGPWPGVLGVEVVVVVVAAS